MMFEINSITEIWRGGATGHSVKGYIYVDTRKTKKKEERDNIVVLLRKGTSSWGGGAQWTKNGVHQDIRIQTMNYHFVVLLFAYTNF